MATARVRLTGILCSVACLLAGSVRAEEPLSLQLDWVAPPECPQQSAVEREIARLLGTNPEASHRVRVSGTLVQEGEGQHRLVLRTEVDDVTGERTLYGNSCQTLSDAAALTIALILNPEPRTPAAEPDPEPESARLSQDSSRTPLPASSRKRPPPSLSPRGATDTPFGLWMVPAFGGELGSLSEPTAEVGIGLALRKGATHAELGASVSPSVRVEGPGHKGAGATARKFTATSLFCYDVTTTAWHLGPCVGVSFRRVEGRGYGVVEPRSYVIHWFSPTVGVTVTRMVRRNLGFRLEASVFGSPHRPTASLDSGDSIYRPQVVGLRVLAGAELSIL